MQYYDPVSRPLVISLDRFQAERKVAPRDTRVPSQFTSSIMYAIVNFNGLRSLAVQIVCMPVQDDVLCPITADDVISFAWSQDARFGHQKNGIRRRLGTVAALEIEPGGSTQRMRLAKLEFDIRSQQDFHAIGEQRSFADLFPVQGDPLVGFNHVFSVLPPDLCVVARQVSKNRNIDGGTWHRLADCDLVVRADEKSTDSIDPE